MTDDHTPTDTATDTASDTPTDTATDTATEPTEALAEPPDDTADDAMSDAGDAHRRRQFLIQRASGVAVVVVISVVALWYWSGFHIEGHGWGDDFSLYLNQARSLVQGDVGKTIADNRYAVDNSAWHTFSPYAYPWGVPLLLAAVMAVTGAVDPVSGIDYAPFKFALSVTFLVALFAYFAVCRRRVHLVAAIVLPMFFATGYWYVNHTDQVLSELPFLMWLMVFVVWLDRVRERGLLLGGSRWQLITLGAIACIAFNTRREGLGLLVGLVAAQLVEAWVATGPGRPSERLRRVRSLSLGPIVTPWVTFLAAAVAAQLVLPSDFLPKYTERDPAAGTGLYRIPDNIRIYRPLLAEQLGLKDPGPTEITAFHSTWWGEFTLYAFVFTAILGVVFALATRARRDAGLVFAALGVTTAVLLAPFQDYRYLMALLPFFLLFAVMGVSIPIRLITRLPDRWPVLVGELAVVALILGGLPDTTNAREYRSGWTEPQSGPQDPDALEMWRAVRSETRGDDVIVFSRARTMTLYTGRKAVQGGAISFIERAGDYYVMYLEADGSPGTYSQYPLTEDEADERGFTEVWRNDGWVIFRTPTSKAHPIAEDP